MARRLIPGIAAALVFAGLAQAEPQTDAARMDALLSRLEAAVARAEAAADRLERAGGGYDPAVTAKAGEALPAEIAPDDMLAALKRQQNCLGDCRGTRVAVTGFSGVRFGQWRHPTPGEIAYSIGVFDNWVIPATVTFQMRRYYDDQTIVQDCVWQVKVWRGENGVVTYHGVGLETGDTTVESKTGPETPPAE